MKQNQTVSPDRIGDLPSASDIQLPTKQELSRISDAVMVDGVLYGQEQIRSMLSELQALRTAIGEQSKRHSEQLSHWIRAAQGHAARANEALEADFRNRKFRVTDGE